MFIEELGCGRRNLDFMKAFDRIPHRPLMEKVSSYNIKGNLLKWIQSFLTGRKQRVMVNGEASSWKNVSSGVPEGLSVGSSALYFIHQ